MYLPDHFREDRPEVLRAFIGQHPLGALVVVTADGLTANHIPMLWHEREGTPGLLQGHIARANPLWKTVAAETPVLVIFGGANRYLTPSWYPAKQQHGKVVPTWNYAVVHAHGTIRFSEDHEQTLRHVSAMTNIQEASRTEPWQVSDAPREFIDSQLKRIVPFEVAITRLVGKFKSSQHRTEDEREAVVAALEAEGVPAADRAELIRQPVPREPN